MKAKKQIKKLLINREMDIYFKKAIDKLTIKIIDDTNSDNSDNGSSNGSPPSPNSNINNN